MTQLSGRLHPALTAKPLPTVPWALLDEGREAEFREAVFRWLDQAKLILGMRALAVIEAFSDQTLFDDQAGALWLPMNAYWEEWEWKRLDTTKPAWALVLDVEADTAILKHVAAGANPITWADYFDFSAGVSTYDELTDTPANKTGSGLKIVRVNAGATALEYGSRWSSGSSWPGTASNGDHFYHTGMAGGMEFVRENGKWCPTTSVLPAAHETFKQLLRGTLTTGNATPTTRTLIRRNAACNKGCFTDFADEEHATHILWHTSGNLWGYGRTSGGNVLIYQHSDHVSCPGNYSDVRVLLNDVDQGAWNQATEPSFTLASVSAGVHKFGIEFTDGVDDHMTFADLVLPQYPYQDLGVAGDVVETIEPLPLCYMTDIGIGRTNNGAKALQGAFGEGILHRLPAGDGVTDQYPSRNPIRMSGGPTFDTSYADFIGRPVGEATYAGLSHDFIGIGDSIELHTTAGLRGQRIVSASPQRVWMWPKLNATMTHASIAASLVRVTTPGGGSAFAASDFALLVTTYYATGASPMAWLWNNNMVAAGLFKLAGV